MKTVKGNPITAAKTQMRPAANVKTNASASSAEAERLVRRAPMPFQTKQGPAQMPVGSGAAALKGIGDGKSANRIVKGGASFNLSASGDRAPGHYDKVVGGQKGSSHPSKKGDVTMGTKKHGNAKFFGR